MMATVFISGLVLIFLACHGTTTIVGCHGFVNNCFTFNQHYFDSNIVIARRKSSTSTSSALHGYANVNDYFASFNSDNNGSNDNDGNEESSGRHVDEKKGQKYFGHGRIGGDGQEGGVFDINNYFSSFGVKNEQDDNASSDDNYNEQSSSNRDIQYAEDQEYQQSQQQPMKQMTYEEIIAYNNARLCPKLLLTQRAIQSFIYLLEECRDPHSGKWLEDYLELQNLGNYHGTAAFNITKHPTWDAVLTDIMYQPNTKMIVSAKRRGRGHGGWSKNNPFLQERYVEFKIDIRPASLVQRLLPVREQLANEFCKDLNIVGMVDGMIMDSYFGKLRSSSMDENDATTTTTTAPQRNAFDRISIGILTNFTEFEDATTSSSGGSLESSPFRRGNFDLLYSLCTQAAAHRFLRELQQESTKSFASPETVIAYEWFRQFYVKHLPEYFDGDQSFGRADDFIDALLLAPPTLVEMSDGKTIGITDPLRIAERIIEIRSEIATEWIGLMKEVKDDHLELNKVLFRVMMGRTIDESGQDDVIEIQEETTMERLSDSTGEFE